MNSELIIRKEIEWHDARRADAGEYAPEEDEEVMVTVETFSGDRRVWIGAHCMLKCVNGDDIEIAGWYLKSGNEKILIWYPVIAWARYPEPYSI